MDDRWLPQADRYTKKFFLFYFSKNGDIDKEKRYIALLNKLP